VYKDSANYYVLQEHSYGGHLRAQLPAHFEKFSEIRIALITIQMLSALKYLHSLNIVHRDLKSQNVILDHPLHFYGETQLVAKLGDHGLSCYVANSNDKKRLEVFCGEHEYLAPELVRQRELRQHFENQTDRKMVYYHACCDMWALGCLVFEMFTGQMPFGKQRDNTLDGRTDLYRRIQNDSVRFEGVLENNQPAQDFIRKCLTRDYE